MHKKGKLGRLYNGHKHPGPGKKSEGISIVILDDGGAPKREACRSCSSDEENTCSVTGSCRTAWTNPVA